MAILPPPISLIDVLYGVTLIYFLFCMIVFNGSKTEL